MGRTYILECSQIKHVFLLSQSERMQNPGYTTCILPDISQRRHKRKYESQDCMLHVHDNSDMANNSQEPLLHQKGEG